MKSTDHINYISIYDKIEVEDALFSRIEAIKKTLTIVTELNKWNFAYAEGKWTIKEVVQHCIDCERIFSFRAQHIAREDNQNLNFFDQNEYAIKSNANAREVKDLIEEWDHLMKSTHYQFLSYSDGTLTRIGKIGDYEYSVEQLGFVIAGHAIHHMNIINERYI